MRSISKDVPEKLSPIGPLRRKRKDLPPVRQERRPIGKCCPRSSDPAGNLEEIRKLANIVETGYLHLDGNLFRPWVKRYFPDWRDRLGDLRHRKLVEFFTSFTVLGIRAQDIVMDAAGGYDTYLAQVDCAKRYLQDIRIPRDLKARLGRGLSTLKATPETLRLAARVWTRCPVTIPSNIFRAIPTPRLLRKFSVCLDRKANAALYRSLRQTIMSRSQTSSPWIENLIRGPRSSLTRQRLCRGATSQAIMRGSMTCELFRNGCLHRSTSQDFTARFLELRLDDAPVPDLTLRCHKRVADINRPMRALVIERFR